MVADWQISKDTESPDAIPYFNWDGPVTNEQVRSALAHGTEDEKLFWIARILREALYWDVWKYLSLEDDVLPRWERLLPILGRRRDFWEFLIKGWRDLGVI